ncbi:uncharacterized protein NECHADRAFT_98798 [Fusarium vanettenii 77-13-4]|uniref:CFEM domain-containing protein n=1 Tax=Fusarium vanettenii (strain ATCC MYA-4622 / CBS 123669 / FGSC 9596 / NRRL 45880 / 77-13-4) TaxID=660122 RepID=C7YH17_FUSV7|nr:uncharacterized protein NECHADRAFT_98798 [Fusarium vanettenii 77-13-4]EEU48556.1 hypothetical protein NECHADRAFT_98798 [Fusarium vanettenii 77-13-4]
MKSTLFIAALFAGLASAQQDKLPTCAQPCVDKYTTGKGIAGCGQFDFKCICSNESFLDGIACCLEGECDDKGKQAAVDYAKKICSTSGVDVPDEVVCKDSAKESANTSASAASASGSNTAASDTASGTASGTAAATTETGTSTETSGSGAAETSSADSGNGASRGTAAGLLGAVMMALAL